MDLYYLFCPGRYEGLVLLVQPCANREPCSKVSYNSKSIVDHLLSARCSAVEEGPLVERRGTEGLIFWLGIGTVWAVDPVKFAMRVSESSNLSTREEWRLVVVLVVKW